MSSDKYDSYDSTSERDMSDAVAEHEERMELFYAYLEDVAPGGIDPDIIKEITSPNYSAGDEDDD